MAATEVILFCSTASTASKPCVQFVHQFKLPVTLVRLDTKQSKQAAANGKYFQITAVPTLVFIEPSGETKLFIGVDKIISFLSKFVSPKGGSVEPQYDEHRSPVPEYDPPKPLKSAMKKKSLKTPKKKAVIKVPKDSSDGDSDGVDIEFLEEKKSTRPPAPPTHGLVVGPKAAGSGKSQMKSLMEKAKEMEKDMHRTYGYNEADLPRG